MEKQILEIMEPRFLEKVEKTDSCWNWKASFDDYGYGMFCVNNKMIHAHRASYMFYVGKLISGLTVDHLCRNRACVNPEHLEQVTNKTNILRGIGLAAQNIKKTHCPQGHLYYHKRNNSGGRICRICQTARTKLWREEHVRK